MTLAFWVSDVSLVAVQSALVALPRTRLPRPLQRLAERLRGRWWSLVPLGSIVVVIVAIDAVGGTADGLTWLALIAVPPLAALALGATMRGGRWWLAPLVVPLFALAWADRSGRVGEAAGVLLSALSCVSLGVMLTAVAPRTWLKVGVVLMAVVDAYLVGSQLLQPANDVLNAAAPPVHLPQLQRALFWDVLIGYGDLFIAGVFGAIVAGERDPHVGNGRAALITFAFALAFDQLFYVLDTLPATVPVALALLAREGLRRRARKRAEQR